jgi:VanZ family protein
MFVIVGASTGLGAETNTSRFVGPLLHFLFPGISEDALNEVHFVIRKCGHLSEYALLGMLLWRALRTLSKFVTGVSLKRQFARVLFFCFLFACTDEIHQRFVPGRDGRFQDVLIDTVGASVGAAMYIGVLRWRKRV